MSKIQRYDYEGHEEPYWVETNEHIGSWCNSEDVSKLEVTLAERDAEIERLKALMYAEYSYSEIYGELKQAQAENAELKKDNEILRGMCPGADGIQKQVRKDPQ